MPSSRVLDPKSGLPSLSSFTSTLATHDPARMLRSTRLLRAARLPTPARIAVSARSLSVSSAPHQQHQQHQVSSSRSAYHPFPVLPTLVDPTSEEYADRARQMQDKEDELRQKWGKVLAGGGDRAQKKAKDAGKLLVRERWVACSLSPVCCRKPRMSARGKG